jgi:hypothetical protein
MLPALLNQSSARTLSRECELKQRVAEASRVCSCLRERITPTSRGGPRRATYYKEYITVLQLCMYSAGEKKYQISAFTQSWTAEVEIDDKKTRGNRKWCTHSFSHGLQQQSMESIFRHLKLLIDPTDNSLFFLGALTALLLHQGPVLIYYGEGSFRSNFFE